MPVPWLQLIDAALGVANFARGRKAAQADTPQDQLQAASRAPGGLEARMAGVVVAALKEAFDRDTRRLDLEREQLAAERERAERALQLELQRQAADREIGRLRLIAGAAGAAWLGSLLLLSRVAGTGPGPRITIGFGWLLLFGAIAASFTAQSRVASFADGLLGKDDDRRAGRSTESGTAALWLMMGGLILVGIAALLA